MKRKILTIAAIVLAVALIMTIGTWVIGRKPFKNLKADEIQSISIHLWPPNESMDLTEAEIEDLHPESPVLSVQFLLFVRLLE